MDLFGWIWINDWLLGFILIIISLYYYYTKPFSYFSSQGIPGPKPIPLFGTARDLVKKGVYQSDHDNCKTYGKLVGCYDGRTPVLLCRDQEILKTVFIREHPNFINRRVITSGRFTSKMLNNAPGELWKTLRVTMSPTFSSGKLKMMTKQINDCARMLIENVYPKAEKGEAINAKEHLGAYSMDVIASTAFGLQLDSHKDANGQFVTMAKKAFLPIRSWFIMVAFFLPFLTPVVEWFGLDVFPQDVLQFFSKITLKTIENRKNEKQDRVDFLQLMMQAHEDNEVDEEHDTDFKKTYKNTIKRGLTLEEVVAQGIIFFLAGYETTATALSFFLHYMAVHPEYQQKLYSEIIEFTTDKDDIDYSTVARMKFLEMCCMETLRICPPALRIERVCNKSSHINGIDFSPGVVIGAPVYAIHHDPEIWTQPELFDPYRFTAENRVKRDTMDYLPFGAGPRMCIASRLALLEFQIAAVHLIKNFHVLLPKETPKTWKFGTGGILQLEEPIKVILEKRK